jgi:DNA-binding transcriptional LysR family regulator
MQLLFLYYTVFKEHYVANLQLLEYASVVMNLTDLHTFSLVAETGTISAAAQRLGVPKSTVSRRVRRLEDSLGCELLRRSPRAVSLTEHGRALHQRSAPSLQELQEAIDALLYADTEPTGTLRVTTVPGFGQSHQFVRCIRDYALKYPKTTIELELTTRLVNLVEEGFDVGLRLHTTGALPGSPAMMSRRLLHFERAMYASPEYIAEMGAPSTLGELAGHRIAAHSIVDVRGGQWNRNGKPYGKSQALPTPRWLINDSAALERFALSGAGLALLPTFEGEGWAARGALVRVLPEYGQQGATASLVWPASRHLAPRVRAFIDHAVETMGP